jgi:hypothetical protein
MMMMIPALGQRTDQIWPSRHDLRLYRRVFQQTHSFHQNRHLVTPRAHRLHDDERRKKVENGILVEKVDNSP